MHPWRGIDEPAVTGGIDIQRDRRPEREGQIAIGEIGYSNGGLVEQRELICGEANEAAPKRA